MRTTAAALAFAALANLAAAGPRAVGIVGSAPTVALVDSTPHVRVVTHRAQFAPPTLPGRARVRINAQSIDISPAVRIEGRGVNARIEAARQRLLRDRGDIVAVRTFRSDRAAPDRRMTPAFLPTPRAIIPAPGRARPDEGPRAEATLPR